MNKCKDCKAWMYPGVDFLRAMTMADNMGIDISPKEYGDFMAKTITESISTDDLLEKQYEWFESKGVLASIVGRCHRHPPVFEDKNRWCWPSTHKSDGCFDFIPKEDEDASR